MSVDVYKPALLSWVIAQAGITAQWRDEQGGWGSKTRARLHLFGLDDVGIGHESVEQDTELEAGEDLVPTYHCDQEVTLTIDVTSRRQDGAQVAIVYLQKLRRSLRKDTVRSALRTAGLACSRTEAPQDLTSDVDGRLESRATMDLFFNAVYDERDEAQAESFVETIEVSSTFEDSAGGTRGQDDEEYP